MIQMTRRQPYRSRVIDNTQVDESVAVSASRPLICWAMARIYSNVNKLHLILCLIGFNCNQDKRSALRNTEVIQEQNKQETYY